MFYKYLNFSQKQKSVFLSMKNAQYARQKTIRIFYLLALFQFHIQLFLNYFTLVSRETMMYYAKEFKILQLREIITRWCCRIIQVLGYSTQRFRNMIIQVFRVKLQFLCRFNYPTIKIIEFKNFAEICLRTIRQGKYIFSKNAKILV